MSRYADATWLNQAESIVSEKQQQANRANAQQSTGPTTPEGKATSKMNAQTHGVYTQRDHWHAQQKHEFDDALTYLIQQYQPKSPEQHMVLAEIAELNCRLVHVNRAYWDLQATYQLKRSALAQAGDEADPDVAFHSVTRMINSMDRLSRLEGRLKRQLDALVQQMITLRHAQTLPQKGTHNGFVLNDPPFLADRPQPTSVQPGKKGADLLDTLPKGPVERR